MLASGLWCKITPLAGRELLLAQQIVATATHLVKLRYVAGVTEECTLAFGTRTLEINAIIDLEERNAELWLYCTEAK